MAAVVSLPLQFFIFRTGREVHVGTDGSSTCGDKIFLNFKRDGTMDKYGLFRLAFQYLA